jgi:hypothetical protein
LANLVGNLDALSLVQYLISGLGLTWRAHYVILGFELVLGAIAEEGANLALFLVDLADLIPPQEGKLLPRGKPTVGILQVALKLQYEALVIK